MATEAGQAYIPIKPDLSSFGRDVGRDVKRHESGLTGAFTGMAKRIGAAFVGAFAISEGFNFLKGAVGAASDLNENVSKSVAVFGDFSDGIDEFARSAAKSVGLSRSAALEATSTFGNLFTQLGVGRGSAAQLSTGMVELAADFASFHNADVTDVVAAQTAAFRGEYDALQRFVPTINAAAVEQKALAMTGKAATKELTGQEKALATHALMMEGAGRAAGDFARTSDGLANQQRIAAARFEDLRAKIGQGLLPVVTALTGLFIDRFIPAVEQVGEFVGRVGRLIVSVWNDPGITSDGWVGVVEQAVTTARAAFEAFLPAVQNVAGFIAGHLQPILLTLAAVFSPGAALVAGVVYAYTRFEAFRDVVDGVAQWLTRTALPAVQAFAQHVADAFGDLVGWTRTHWAEITEAIRHVTATVRAIVVAAIAAVTAAWRVWGDELVAIAQAAWGFIRGTVENAVKAVRAVIETVLAVINGDWGDAWRGMRDLAGAVWDQIVNVVRLQITAAKQVISGTLDTIAGVWRGVWGGIESAFSGLWARIRGIVGDAVDWIRRQIDRALGPVDELIARLGRVRDNSITIDGRTYTGGAATRHDGGWVTASMPQFPGLRSDERLIKAQVGEYVLPRGETPFDYERLAASMANVTFAIVDANGQPISGRQVRAVVRSA